MSRFESPRAIVLACVLASGCLAGEAFGGPAGALPAAPPALALAAPLASAASSPPASAHPAPPTSAAAARAWRPEMQVAARVPFEPTAFLSEGRQYLIYELFLTNFEDHTLRLDRVEALDLGGTQPLASLGARELNTSMHLMGQPIVGDQIASPDDDSQRDIGAGQTSLVYLLIRSEGRDRLPPRLTHRLVFGDDAIQTATVSTHHDKVHVIGPPLKGGPWVAGSGPGNESHHRRQLLVTDGIAHFSSRFAIDWSRLAGTEGASGNPQDNRSYSSYDQPVLAIADATVAATRDGIPENVPGHFGKGKMAVPMSADTFFGNSIVLDLGGGQYAYYAHLKPGSLSVKPREPVRKGQVIAHVGDSGSSFEPHLHFEITNSRFAAQGDGIPYAFDHYTVTSKDGAAERRSGELPLDGTRVTFSD